MNLSAASLFLGEKNRSLNHPARIYLLLECNPLVLYHSWVYFFMLVPLGFVAPTGCCSRCLRSDCAREVKTAMTSFLSERLRLQSCNAFSSCPRLNSHCLSVQFCFLFCLSCLNEPCFLQRLAPRQIVDESVLFVVLNWRFNSPLL